MAWWRGQSVFLRTEWRNEHMAAFVSVIYLFAGSLLLPVHTTTLILNRIISTSLTNSFPARANKWILQKLHDSSRHFWVSQLVKSCTSLTSSSIKQCGVSLRLSQVEIFLPNEQASETVDSLQQQNYVEFWEMQLAAQHDWIEQDYNERK